MLRPHVVIIGAGFGGTYVGKKLVRMVKRGKIDLTMVNKTNYFLFTPLLHEVATGSLSPRSVAEPLREIFRNTNIRIVQGEITSVDRVARMVKVNGHGSDEKCLLKYDYLVIATGAETNYYGISGAKEYALPLKSLSDAVTVRSRVIDAFERAVLTEDPAERKSLLSFVVVGGGPTGVEVAAELAEFTEQMVRRYYGRTHCRPDDPRRCESEEATVTLIHAGHELLEQFHPSLRRSAEAKLRGEGISLEIGTVVTSVSRQGLTVGDGRTIPASTVIWAAGVKPVIPHLEGEQPELVAGRLPVDEHFNLICREGTDPHVFVLGDAAGYIGEEGKALPQLAQVAEGESKIIAKNVKAVISGKRLKSFSYKSKGSMVSVGQWFAIGEIYSLNLAGWLTWWLWRTVYLFKFASWRKRIRIALEWAFELISPRDITKVI